MLALLGGCGTFGLDRAVADSPTGELRIDGIDPAWGPPEGGTTVTITGSGFTGGLTVTIRRDGVDVTRIDDGTLVVESPEAGMEAAVDVVVTSSLGEVKVNDGFTFAEEEPEESDADTDADADADADADTDSDSDTDLGTSGVVEFSLLQYACPECTSQTSDLSITAAAAFHDPADTSWLDWLPRTGSCTEDLERDTPASRYDDVGDWIYLNSGGHSVGLRGSRDGSSVSYAASGISETDFVRTAFYDLSVPDGADWGAFAVVDAVETPQGFSDIQPVNLLQISNPFSQRISQAGQTFTWAPSGGDGSFLVFVSVYNDASRLLGAVLCRGADNGELDVPSAYLSRYPIGSLVLVDLWRYQIGSFPLPNGGDADAVASVGVEGTGVIGP